MGRPAKDWTGVQINELTVLERDYSKPSGNGRHAFWKCRCSCGNVISIAANKLAKGQISCGCKNKIEDNYYIGKSFQALTVIGISDELDANNHHKLICKCDCGNITTRTRKGLTANKFHCCKNCFLKRQAKLGNQYLGGLSQEEIQSRIGLRFGRLVVIERTEQRSSNKERLWRCRCDCGNKKLARWDNLINGRVSSCGCLVSKGEQKIKQLLGQNNIIFQEQYHFNDLLSTKNKPLMFDFAIFLNDKLHCLIEYQGIQHYDKNNKFYSEDAQYRDKQKREYCKKHHIPLIEIPYTDFDIIDFDYLKNKCLF